MKEASIDDIIRIMIAFYAFTLIFLLEFDILFVIFITTGFLYLHQNAIKNRKLIADLQNEIALLKEDVSRSLWSQR
jgi:ABC-type uncharacterized transport system permease subunit